MLILKFTTLFIMLIGLVCTLAPRLYGTVIILMTAIIYAFVTEVSVLGSWVWSVLLLLTFLAEIIVRGLRIFLTRRYRVSRRYSVDTSICNVAGIVATSTLLGAFWGTAVWEILVGKTLLTRFAMISKILLRLLLMAGVRLLCGFIMVMIIMKYIMYKI